MGKKKPFIDKKNASTYQLIHRSQRDVGGALAAAGGGATDEGGGGGAAGDGGDGGGMILWPTESHQRGAAGNLAATDRAVLLPAGNNNGNNSDDRHHTANDLAAWKHRLSQMGLLDESEEYLKPITGAGTFVDAGTGRPVLAGKSKLQPPPQSQSQSPVWSPEEGLVELHRQMDSLPLTADCMDEDIAAALFGRSGGGGGIDGEGDNTGTDAVDIFDTFEEIDDYFMLDAAAAPPDEEEEENDAAAAATAAAQSFDFDVHIQQLIHKAKLANGGTAGQPVEARHHWGQHDRAYFGNLRPLHETENDEDETDDGDWGGGATLATEPGVVAKLSPAEERALCEKFEATLAEYDTDSDNDDDDDNNCEYDNEDGNTNNGEEKEEDEYQGLLPLEGDAAVEAALDDYLTERADDIFIQGPPRDTKRAGGSGFAVLVGTRMVPAKDLAAAAEAAANGDATSDPRLSRRYPEQEPAVPLADYMAAADYTLAQPKQQPPPETIFMDGTSYYTDRVRNPWDCESILSTYSNLDNNPVTIDGTVRRRRRQRNKMTWAPGDRGVADGDDQDDDEPTQLIRLSAKTGLPIGVFDRPTAGDFDDDDDDLANETMVSINRGVARSRLETPEEKKGRKLLVRRERELARIQKKMTREVYAEEFQKRCTVGDQDLAGRTVFRFS